ncbi:MAG TPA: urease accessory protein UreJ [Gammaproteobacteria bacterium]|nr:urease accessory protein UreJ [Gammaproteobacteria bacterium]
MNTHFRSPSFRQRLLTALALWSVLPVAMAHPGHGGGLAEGLLHPLTGLDHLLAMITAGLLLGRHLRHPVSGVLIFVAAFGIGLILASTGSGLPGMEYALIATVPLAGLILWRVRTLPAKGLLGGLALVATLHGLAHGFEAPAMQALYWQSGAVLMVLFVTGLAAGIGHTLRDHPTWLQRTGLGVFGMGMILLGS